MPPLGNKPKQEHVTAEKLVVAREINKKLGVLLPEARKLLPRPESKPHEARSRRGEVLTPARRTCSAIYKTADNEIDEMTRAWFEADDWGKDSPMTLYTDVIKIVERVSDEDGSVEVTVETVEGSQELWLRHDPRVTGPLDEVVLFGQFPLDLSDKDDVLRDAHDTLNLIRNEHVLQAAQGLSPAGIVSTPEFSRFHTPAA